MLDRLLGFDHTLWLVAFAFYAFDVTVIARPHEVLFAETGRRLRPVLARVPFAFRGGDLYWIAPLAPFLGVFRAGMTGTTAPGADPLDAAQRALAPFRYTSTLIFVLLFIAGPALTAWRGLGMAALMVLPPAYLISLVSVVLMARRASAFGLARRARWSLGFDCLACIPYAANLTKRLAWRVDGRARGPDWLARGATPEERAHVQAVLAERQADPPA